MPKGDELDFIPPCIIDLHSQSLQHRETIKSLRRISLLGGWVCFLVHLDLDGVIETRLVSAVIAEDSTFYEY